MKWYYILILSCLLFSNCESSKNEDIEEKPRTVWTAEEAWDWYNDQTWKVGANFNPAYSVNQLEFWMDETWDAEAIKRELQWASDIGMNVMRVYLHNLLWQHEKEEFINHLDEYLSIADSYDVKTIFVLLDDVWHPNPFYGKQLDPIPHVHNSRWVQAPGAAVLINVEHHDVLYPYINGVISRYANDDRVVMWDLYNEPDNVSPQTGELAGKAYYSLELLKKVVRWAHSAQPSQPITIGIWRGDINHWGNLDSLPSIDSFMVTHSDIVSFHAYDGSLEDVKEKINQLKNYGKPMICTEYLARGRGNTFQSLLPLFRDENIWAINWGLVSGKTQTIYPWESWNIKYTSEPDIWHHDIFRKDGTPYDQEEVDLIRNITSN